MGLFLPSIKNKLFAILSIGIFFASILFNIALPSSAFAVNKVSDMSPDNAAKAFVYYKGLYACLDAGGMTPISSTNAQNFGWFERKNGSPPTDVGVYGDNRDGGDGQHSCGGNDQGKRFLRELASLTGYPDGASLLCDIGFTREVNKSNCSQVVSGANNNFIAPSDPAKTHLNNWWKGIIGAADVGPDNFGPGNYSLYYNSFIEACGVTKGSGDYTIMAPNADGTKLENQEYAINNTSKNKNTSVRVYSGRTYSCNDLANLMKDSSQRAVKAMTQYLAAGNSYTPAADNVDVIGGTEETSSCKVDGIGWVICPVVNAMAGMTDASFDIVSAFMEVKPLGFDTEQPLYRAWATMRTIANIAFVIAFLIIIFSQLTSAGITNYGVKKMLPRLVIAVLLVNVSYYICAIAIDLSNIAGAGVYDLLGTLTDNTVLDENGNDTWNWGSIATSVLTLGAAGGIAAGVFTSLSSVGIWAALAGLLPLLVSALFALIIAFIVLLARQALIVLLVMISPLAFVAYLLPNTENLYKKWQNLFVTLLTLFPMLALVFGGATFAAAIIRESGRSLMETGAGAEQVTGFFLYMGSLAVIAIPFFITPVLIKLSGGVLNRFAGFVNNKNVGPFDRLRKGGERIAKDAQNRSYTNRLKAGTERLESGKRFGISRFGARRRNEIARTTGSLEAGVRNAETDAVSETLKGELNSGNYRLASRMAGGDLGQAQIIAQKAVAGAEAEDLKDALQPLLRQLSTFDPTKKREILDAEVLEGGSRQAAAYHYAAQIGDVDFLRNHQAGNDRNGVGHPLPSTVNLGDVQRNINQAINANAGSIVGKAPDMVKGDDAAFGSVKGKDLVQFKPSTAKKYIDYIEALSLDPTKAQKYRDAVNGFNSAIDDISKSPDLQGEFSADVGRALSEKIAAAGIAGKSYYGDLGGAAGIQSDGKIR